MIKDATVLLVSDRAAVDVDYLKSAGFKVSVVRNSTEAIERLVPGHGFDLLLTDINKDDAGVLELLKHIKRNDIEIEVVVQSTETSFEKVNEAYQMGIFEFVPRPIDDDYMIGTLQKALNKRAREQSVNKLRRQRERAGNMNKFMIDNSPDMIFILDKAGTFRYVNDKALEQLGYFRNELIGQHYIKIVDPGSVTRARHYFSDDYDFSAAKETEEIWLNCKPGLTPDQNRRIAIQLHATGFHETDSGVTNSKKEINKFSGIYVVAREVTERLASDRLIHYQAYHDLLTGLPNKMLFLDRLANGIAHAKRNKTKLAVMFLDLDRFKVVNDSVGHAFGDQLLKAIAARLKSCLRASDTLSRMGGDEFLVMVPDIMTLDAAVKVVDKLLRAIRTPFNMGNHEFNLTASIGVSLFPDDGDSAEAMMKHADLAMYYTKDRGRDGFKIYNTELGDNKETLLTLENEIRKGLKEGQFVNYYQPQVMTDNGSIVGAEALVRWKHPEKGILSPLVFLGVAEESGMIVELGDQVLEQAVRDFMSWRKQGLISGKLAVNYSYRQIDKADFVGKITRVVREHNMPPELLEVEITEGSLMRDPDGVISKLKSLSDTGVRIALDDFGTGYSSLSLLQKLPVNTLKIDRSFIQDLEENSKSSIIEAIASMAKSLGLDLIAEGVETRTQLNYLQDLHCPVAQGHIFSKGLNSDLMLALLETQGMLEPREQEEEDEDTADG